ncbi:DMT family transporter [Paracoccus sp. (in: a-proteobacteria)]|uniref:DMT family transporter n=1 Tax=Paracoccus sp. TaxID=267 RepID=UPI003A8B6B91
MPELAPKVVAASRHPSATSAMAGIAFMAGGFFFYATSDMLAKLLTQSMHPLQVAWTRQLGLFAVVLVLLTIHGTRVLRSRHPVLQLSRGLTAVVTSASFIFAVAYVPLADAVTVTFVAPFIVTVLAALILHESVGTRRWIAVALGFAGTLVVIRPGAGVFHPAIFLVLVTSTAFALRQILSRLLSGDEPILTTIAYTGLTASLLLTIPLPFIWTTPADWRVTLLMLGTAATAGIAELAIIRALELAQAVVLAPVQYTLMIWSTLWGFLVFGQLPDGWTVAGAAIIAASGAYSLWREYRLGRRLPAALPG